ncbi:ABC-type spermidine/putrescine transport system permease subunit II [Agrobacterium vitis]|nr:ABC-type spermidine/putrescine transport system permease subunit II [Agrobacterium vitis]MBE1436575.1 ABC-type spermidine/putrescine transport system permease subunit II [Agrobacterium vitis]
MKTGRILKWSVWSLLAIILISAIYLPSILIVAYRFNPNLEYVALAMLIGIFLNFLFKDKKFLYASAFSLPLLSAVILPHLLPTVVAACIALIWGVLSFLLGAIRDRI